MRGNATKTQHPFTEAKAGGWGWTNLSGSVPDGDDTSGALVALHALLDGKYVPEVGAGIDWLIDLQNMRGDQMVVHALIEKHTRIATPFSAFRLLLLPFRKWLYRE